MSRTRTTPDSPTEITDPKRRSLDKDHSPIDALFSTKATPNSSNEIKDSKRPSAIDIIDALFRSLPSPGPPPVRSTIRMLRNEYSISRLAEILVNSEELVEKAKAAIQILKDGILNPDQGVLKLTNAVREFWLSRCFINGLRTSIEKHVEVIGPVLHFANQDPACQRWELMKEDPFFIPFLMNLDSAASTNLDILRLFLCILIGYWGDKGELTKLDDAMGNAAFGRRMAMEARFREKLAREKGKKNGVEKEVKNFMCFIKDADDAENSLKLVQHWLVSTYGNDKNVNTDALLEEIESEISPHLKISPKAGLYNGKRAKIHIRIAGGLHPTVCLEYN